jgi:hypothetical protein
MKISICYKNGACTNLEGGKVCHIEMEAHWNQVDGKIVWYPEAGEILILIDKNKTAKLQKKGETKRGC